MIDNITPINRLMIQACLAPLQSEHENFVRNWEKCVVFDDLDYSSMRLVPLFLHKNQQFGTTTKYDARLKIIYKHWWLRTQHIFDQLKKVCDAFINEGIAPVIIKGASLITYYERRELRPMSDFDLLIKPSEITTGIDILKGLGYLPDKVMEATFRENPTLLTDFRHSISFTHIITGTEIDLHWRISSLCSSGFTDKLWLHLDNYETIPGARKPQLAYEVFMIIMHGVLYGSFDNANWIIDIALLNLQTDRSFWEKARQLAVIEKKQDLFDYGCSILLKFDVYSPIPQKTQNPGIIKEISVEERSKMSILKFFVIKTKNFLLFLRYLFPNSGYPVKLYQGIRLIRLFLIYRKYKWLYKPKP